VPYLLYEHHVPVFIYEEPFSFILLEKFSFILDDVLLNVSITSLLIFIQGIWLNNIVNEFSILYKGSYLPSLCYVITASIFPGFLTLNACTLSIFFLLWIFIRLFRLYKSNNALYICFDSGMIIALASLFYFPSVLWLLIVFFALLLFRPFIWREWLAAICGFMVPYIFLAMYYFWNDKFGSFTSIWEPLQNKIWNTEVDTLLNNFIPLIPLAIILLLAIVRLRANFYKNVLQVRKSQQLIIISIFICAASYYIKPSFELNHFIVLTPMLSIFAAYYFMAEKRKWIAELLMLTLIGSVLYFQII
jgi:hypothetical protein